MSMFEIELLSVPLLLFIQVLAIPEKILLIQHPSSLYSLQGSLIFFEGKMG